MNEMVEAIPVTKDDVRAFLDGKKAKLKCEVCGRSAWLIYADRQVEGLDAALVLCGNCGNPRWHLHSVINRWKQRGY